MYEKLHVPSRVKQKAPVLETTSTGSIGHKLKDHAADPGGNRTGFLFSSSLATDPPYITLG